MSGDGDGDEAGLAADLEAMHRQAQGLLQLHIIRPADAAAVNCAAALGDGLAMQLSALIDAFVARNTTPGVVAPVCLGCAGPLYNDCAVALVLPAAPGASQGLALGCCTDCATTDAEIVAKTAAALKFAWPDARPVRIQHDAAGHA